MHHIHLRLWTHSRSFTARRVVYLDPHQGVEDHVRSITCISCVVQVANIDIDLLVTVREEVDRRGGYEQVIRRAQPSTLPALQSVSYTELQPARLARIQEPCFDDIGYLAHQSTD